MSLIQYNGGLHPSDSINSYSIVLFREEPDIPEMVVEQLAQFGIKDDPETLCCIQIVTHIGPTVWVYKKTSVDLQDDLERIRQAMQDTYLITYHTEFKGDDEPGDQKTKIISVPSPQELDVALGIWKQHEKGVPIIEDVVKLN